MRKKVAQEMRTKGRTFAKSMKLRGIQWYTEDL
jgi:hypothetical protein